MQLERKVDIFTYNRELHDEFIREFPGRIFESQFHMEKLEDGKKLYGFFDLPYNLVEDFLSKVNGDAEYELRDSKTGKFLSDMKMSEPAFSI